MFVARAPGKLVALGEYAVLDGAPAVVLALDRYVEAAIEPERRRRVPPDDARRRGRRAAVRAGRAERRAARRSRHAAVGAAARVDGDDRLAGACSRARASSAWGRAPPCSAPGPARSRRSRAAQGGPVPQPRVEALIELHRQFQGGKGSGLDVAASYTGGAITFSLAPSRSAPNWFSPPAEQCRIRGYFCRPVCFYARVGCALPGLAPGSAAGGGGAGSAA